MLTVRVFLRAVPSENEDRRIPDCDQMLWAVVPEAEREIWRSTDREVLNETRETDSDCQKLGHNETVGPEKVQESESDL